MGQQLFQPIFGPYDFAGLVGLWLTGRDDEAANLLSPFISTDSFNFDATEYVELQQDLQNLRRQYAKLPAVSTALDDLNTGFFRHQESGESETYIRRTVDRQSQACTRLQYTYATAIYEQARYDEAAAARRLTTLANRLRGSSDQLEQALTLGAKQRKSALSALRESINEIGRLLKAGPSTTVERDSTTWPLTPDPAPARLAQAIADLATQLNEKRRNYKLIVQRELLNLSATTATAPGIAERLQAAQNGITDLLRELNEAGLYQLPFNSDIPPTAQRQQQLIAGIAARLRNTAAHLHEWPAYHERSRIWYAQPARLRRLTAPLLEYPTEQWQAAFRGWYLARCLEKHAPEVKVELPALATKRGQLRQGNERANMAEFACVIDLREDSTSEYWRPAPYHDPRASHYSLAPPDDRPALFFQQPYHLAERPDWQLSADVHEGPLGVSPGKVSNQATVVLGAELTPELSTTTAQDWPKLIATQRLKINTKLTDTQVTEALLSDGANGAFLAAVLIRAAAAASSEERDALGRELHTRLGLPSPPADPLAAFLATKFPDSLTVETDVPWRFTRLPLIITDEDSGLKTVYLYNYELGECAGAMKVAEEALGEEGYRVKKIDPLKFWWAPEQAIADLVG